MRIAAIMYSFYQGGGEGGRINLYALGYYLGGGSAGLVLHSHTRARDRIKDITDHDSLYAEGLLI